MIPPRLLPPGFRGWRPAFLAGDLTAAVVVAMLLVPQAMAYAALAGLPPYVGLYASILPLVAYALAGSSRVLAVGPVAMVSLLTASALAPLADIGTAEQLAAAAVLALMVGVLLFVFGMLRLGALANLLSHPVISGFVTGAAILILAGQLAPLLGLSQASGSVVQIVIALAGRLPDVHVATALVGGGALLALWLARSALASLLMRVGVPEFPARLVGRLAPMIVVAAASLLAASRGLEAQGVRVVGEVPATLPVPSLPVFDVSWFAVLFVPALVIALVGYVESVSIAGALARQRGERLDANAELRGLGLANLASGISGALPVAGGLSRTAVNADAGARSPVAAVVTALLIALLLPLVGPLLATLPLAVLAAIIIVAVVPLIDVHALVTAWRYDRVDALAWLGTAGGVILFGIESGLALGVALALAGLVWRASRPHVAIVGQVPGTGHFRNVLRHDVLTRPGLLMLRVDENLFFGNADAVRDRIEQAVDEPGDIRELVLVMSSVSHIDSTALEMLESLQQRLGERGIRVHLSEVKGPVLDRLHGTRLLAEMRGEVFLSNEDAYMQALSVPREGGRS